MRALLKKPQPTAPVTFLGETLKVRKLTTKQARDFQAKIEDLRKEFGEESAETGMEIQRYIIRSAVVGAEDMTDDELDSFPLADFAALVTDVLEAAGLKAPVADEKGND